MWNVSTADRARKVLGRAPRNERDRLLTAIREFAVDPKAGDIKQLTNERSAYRKRVGPWRIFFDVYPDEQLVHVVAIERRTSITYRKR